jgi:hypothetical protein
MDFIESKKGAGLATANGWDLTEGQLPKQKLTWHCWVDASDPDYLAVVAHMKSLI